MARRMDSYNREPSDTVWRAVITHVNKENGYTHTEIYGPFSMKGSATAAAKRESKSWKMYNSTFKIEKSKLDWKPIDEEA